MLQDVRQSELKSFQVEFALQKTPIQARTALYPEESENST
jgi:hypothetical protein